MFPGPAHRNLPRSLHNNSSVQVCASAMRACQQMRSSGSIAGRQRRAGPARHLAVRWPWHRSDRFLRGRLLARPAGARCYRTRYVQHGARRILGSACGAQLTCPGFRLCVALFGSVSGQNHPPPACGGSPGPFMFPASARRVAAACADPGPRDLADSGPPLASISKSRPPGTGPA